MCTKVAAGDADNAQMERRRRAQEAKAEREAMMAATRARAAAIDSYLDMIPIRFFFGTDSSMATAIRENLDPEKAKRTSQMLIEAAQAESEAVAKTKREKAKLDKKDRKRKAKIAAASEEAGDTGAEEPAEAEAERINSRKALHEKLERRISELREERRKKQSEIDKAKAEQVRETRIAAGLPHPKELKAQRLAEKKQAAPAATAAAEEDVAQDEDVADSEAEVGNLTFEPRQGDLPYEAGVNRRGSKARKLRAELRKQEKEERKVSKAEARGEVDEVRHDLAMQKALMRAQGVKVHDDSSRTRKAQKMMDLRRKKGKEKREEAKRETKQQQEDKQAKRKENLTKRTSNKKKNKLRHGFEGKRGGAFINKD
mmetsp:Transcript_17873/g.34852  ORF Transcript_17873/g.34852 Transcript_17873/m.34852 type:complete len:371 (-) Transcript_17873:52-1164(-)